jgi:RHS repeat-associated protein
MAPDQPQPSANISFRMYVLVVMAVRKDPQTWDTDFSAGGSITARGYTMHNLFRPFGKHLDDFGLINMPVLPQRSKGRPVHPHQSEGGNGRIYDPTLGRFLSPDNHIQAPDNPQNYNRYSYVLNNPMRYTDPTGYSMQPHPDDDNRNNSPTHHDIASDLGMPGVDWRSGYWGQDQHFWFLSVTNFEYLYGEGSYGDYLIDNGYLRDNNANQGLKPDK